MKNKQTPALMLDVGTICKQLIYPGFSFFSEYVVFIVFCLGVSCEEQRSLTGFFFFPRRCTEHTVCTVFRVNAMDDLLA